MKKVCALFTLYGKDSEERFKHWIENSINSFKKWHPDIEVIFDKREYIDYGSLCINRMYKMYELFENGYTKIISLDIDTITCARFTEFLEDDTTPFLGTQGFPCHSETYINENLFFIVPHREIAEYPYANTGVYCINSKEFLDEWLQNVINKNINEEITINLMIKCGELNRIKIIDYPYKLSSFCYNVRLFDIFGSDCIRDDGIYLGVDGPLIGYGNPTSRIIPCGDKLINKDGKWIKCLHFAFCKTSKHTKADNLDDFIPETVEWLKKYSDYVPRSLVQSTDAN